MTNITLTSARTEPEMSNVAQMRSESKCYLGSIHKFCVVVFYIHVQQSGFAVMNEVGFKVPYTNETEARNLKLATNNGTGGKAEACSEVDVKSA